MKKYIIYSPSYNEKVGGVVVLHNLCDMLNHHGVKALICPPIKMSKYWGTSKSTWENWKFRLSHPLSLLIGFAKIIRHYLIFKRLEGADEPLVSFWKLLFCSGLKDYIIVYPEIVAGNPLNAKNVVRYLMHEPGHFTGKVEYGYNELICRYNDFFATKYTPNKGSYMPDRSFTISTSPPYFTDPGDVKRSGTAYCIRKGKGKKIIHDTSDSILIDDLPLKEVAEIFKKVEKFISYDPATALSTFALRCHCPSYRILTAQEYQDHSQRNDLFELLAYDLEEKKDWEECFRKAEERQKALVTRNQESIKALIATTQDFFR